MSSAYMIYSVLTIGTSLHHVKITLHVHFTMSEYLFHIHIISYSRS